MALNFLGTKMNYTATCVPRPIVYMTMRAELDGHLAQLLPPWRAGVRLVESCRVKQIVVKNEFMEIISDRENFRAKVCHRCGWGA